MALALLLFAVTEMGGCGMGTTELPATTQPGGPGFLSITTPQISDSIQGLSYTATINTTGGSNTLAACTVISGTLPPGLAPPEPQGSNCILTSNGRPVQTAGHYTFTLQAGDTSTPQRTDNHVYNLTVRPEFVITSPAILDGVAGRSYTRTFTVTTNLQNHAAGQVVTGSSEAGNGPATNCAISGFPGAVAASCAIDGSRVNTTITMQASTGTLAAGTYPFSISVADSPIASSNQTLPAVPAGTVTLPLNLVVRPEFAITQAALADGVQGRTYGVSPLAQPVATDLSATALSESGEPTEAGNGPVTACALSVTASNPGLAVAPNQNNCMLASASPVAVAPTYGAQSYSVTVSATDNPITDPVSGQIVVPANTIIKTLQWTAQAPISYSLNFDTLAGQPGQVPDAVQNRTYGAPVKSELEATAIGGLSNETGAAIVESGALPPGLTCGNGAPNPTPVLLCGSGGAPVTSAPGTISFVVAASDPGNTATPPGSSATDLHQHASHVINVDMPLALATNFSSPLPQAVMNQNYGAAPLTPLQYTASGGLGGYHFTTATGQTAPGNGFPAGIACAQGSGASANAFSCATPVGTGITAGASTTTPYTPTVTLDDTANGTTPDGAASGTGSSQTSSLTVNPPLSITASGSASPAPPPGVAGRTYGVGSGLQALVYSISGGIQPYTITAINATGAPSADSVPTPMTCTGVPGAPAPPTQLVCESASGIAANPGTYPFTVSVHDAGTASDPVSTATLGQSVVINAAMTLTPQSTSPPLAVIGRTYGSGGNCGTSGTTPCAPIVYNISGGLGGYSPTPTISGFPGTFTCPLSASGLSGTYSCSTAGAVAGTNPATLSLSASDTANTATPAVTLPSANVSLAIAQPLTLTLTSGAPPTAVFGRAYGTGPSCSGGTCAPVVYAIANGTGVYPASASLTTAAGSFSCALAGSSYDCASTSITLNPGASPATESLNVSVNDVANASTPSANVSNSSATLTVNLALNIAGPSGTLAIAVDGRTYGTGSACGALGTTACASIGYNITGGLGGYSSTPTLNLYPTTFACPFASTGALSGTYTCSSSGGVTGSGTPSVSITAADTANTSTPTATATSKTATLPISPALSITPPTTVNPAVQGRAYGTGTGCSGTGGTCAPLPYGISGGTTQYPTTASLTAGTDTFACPLSSTTYNCSSADITGATGSPTLTFSVSDIADASTPAPAAPVGDSTKSLTIDAPLSLTLTSGTPAPAVAGRAYGTGNNCGASGTAACAPITYSISNGLGGYTSSIAVSGSPTSITGLGCTLSGSTYSCLASTLGPGNLSPAVSDTLSISTSDTANPSTPSGTTPTNTAASLTIDPAMAIAPASGQPNPATLAVVGSPYGSGTGCSGSGGTCAPIKYTVSGGLGNYGAATLTESSQALTGISCSLSGSTYSCSSASLGPTSLSSAVAADTLSITATETGNAS
ncbi:MAG: beta strand repeat-containing protein, partial [Terriglobales bacterium]